MRGPPLRWACGGAVALGLLVGGPDVAEGSERGAGCVEGDERAVVRSERVVVVRDRRAGGIVRFVACLRGSGDRTVLGQASSGPGFGSGLAGFSTAGTYVAWATWVSGRGGVERSTVRVRDLRRPGRTRSASVPWLNRVYDTVVDARGHVAARSAIHVLSMQGDWLRVVDTGVPRSLRDLRLEGGVVRWRHSGQPRSAPVRVPWGGCAPPAGAAAMIGDQAVVVTRYRARGPSSLEVSACLRGAGGFRVVGHTRGAVAGSMAAAVTGPSNAARVRVVDLRDGMRTVADVPLSHGAVWTIASEGTVAVTEGVDVVVYWPDGRRAVVGRAPAPPYLAIDETLGRVTWGGRSARLP